MHGGPAGFVMACGDAPGCASVRACGKYRISNKSPDRVLTRRDRLLTLVGSDSP
jgi:hypothetical protein